MNIHWQPGMTLEALEETAVKQAFRFYQENKTATARALEISVRTLEAKLEKYEQTDRELAERLEQRRQENNAFIQRARGVTSGTPTENASQDGKESAPIGASSQSRFHVQPAEESAQEPDMSLPVRKEVQSVSPKQASGYNSGKRR